MSVARTFSGIVVLLVMPSFAAGAAEPGSAKTFSQAYQAALQRSETIGIQEQLLVQADELEGQAKAALFPTVNGALSFFKQQGQATIGGSQVSPTTQNTARITADQPLFKGFRDFAALRQRNAAINAQSFAVQNAARQLFYDTATAFYNVLAFKSDEVNYLNEIKVNQKRLVELKNFIRVGRSRVSELLTFQANISALESQLEVTRGQLETAKDVLAFLAGWNRETPLADVEPDPGQPPNVGLYLEKIDQRADVKLAGANVQVFQEGVPIAWGQHLPSVDLIGDYFPSRPGYLSDVTWDVQLAITMPLFQGGAIQAQVRQAESVVQQYNLLLSQTRRVAEEEIRTFYNTLSADVKTIVKLGETRDWSKKSYEIELRDYRNGLVTNLEVLQAITTYQDSQRLLDRAGYLIKADAAKLQAASAERPEIAIVKP